MKKIIFILSVCSNLTLFSCSHFQPTPTPRVSPIKMNEILSQVEQSIRRAQQDEVPIENKPKPFPKITAVKLDMKVSSSRNLNGKFDLGILGPEVGRIRANDHSLSMTFSLDQKNKDELPYFPSRMTDTNPELTEAIRGIFKSVLNSQNHFDFRGGSFKLNCQLKENLGGRANHLKLIPFQIDGAVEKEATQTITIFFGPSLKKNAAPEIDESADLGESDESLVTPIDLGNTSEENTLQ